MQTDFIIWSFVNNSISKFGNGNFLIDLSLFIGIIYFLLPHYAKNIIRRYIKNLINGKENLIEFSLDSSDHSPGSKRLKAILRYIENNNNLSITSAKELRNQKWDSKIDTYREDESVYQINQYNKFNITEDIFGRVFDNKEDVSKGEYGTKYKTITYFQIYSYKRSLKNLIDWTEEVYQKYENEINKKFQKNQYLIRVFWDFNVITESEIWNSKINFSKMYFPNKENTLKKIDLFLNNRDWFDKKGIPWKLGIILHGKPGTGKTTFIRSLVNYTKRHVVDIKLNPDFPFNKLSSIIGGKLGPDIELKPEDFIIVIEDIDTTSKILHKRDEENFVKVKNGKDSPVNEKQKEINTLSQFLNDLDGIRERPGSIMIFTTNHLDKLDPAVFRAGRMDININMDNYSKEDIYNLCKTFWKKDFKYKKDDIKDSLENNITSSELINIFRNSNNINEIKDILLN